MSSAKLIKTVRLLVSLSIALILFGLALVCFDLDSIGMPKSLIDAHAAQIDNINLTIELTIAAIYIAAYICIWRIKKIGIALFVFSSICEHSNSIATNYIDISSSLMSTIISLSDSLFIAAVVIVWIYNVTNVDQKNA